MYKAIEEIGGYQIGDEVPTEKAEAWAKMYKKSPVELVGGKSVPKEEVKLVPEEKVESEELKPTDVMLDDYLARGKNVVRKNILEDNLSKDQLKKLLVMEESDKNRYSVIEVIKEKLNI